MKVQERIKNSDLVIVGKVASITIAKTDEKRFITFHDPEWNKAILEIESVEKGEFNKKNVTVFFPSSIDIMWYKAPKFREGHDGIWILRKSKLAFLKNEEFTALDPQDFHPMQERDTIRNIIQKLRAETK